MSEIEELEELVSGLTKGLDELRSTLSRWADQGPHEVHRAESGGVVAEATLARGLTSLHIDRSWVEARDLDEVGRCVVQAVNDAENAGRAAVWSAVGAVRLGTTSLADLGDPAARERWQSSPEEFFTSFHPSTSTNGEDA